MRVDTIVCHLAAGESTNCRVSVSARALNQSAFLCKITESMYVRDSVCVIVGVGLDVEDICGL